MSAIARNIVEAARQLAAATGRLQFRPPVTHVYQPLNYDSKFQNIFH